jgi:hypothetical protein
MLAYRSSLAVVRGQPVSIAVLLTTRRDENAGDPQEVVDALADVLFAQR